MDFRHLVATPASLSEISADALLLVVHGSAINAALAPVLSALVGEAVEAGDLQLKAGRSLYLHRPAGVKAARQIGRAHV